MSLYSSNSRFIVAFLALGLISLIFSSFTGTEPVESESSQLSSASETTGVENGHQWVDLGLPSGTLWATCNVGSSTPEGYGDYFAWGKVEPTDVKTITETKLLDDEFDLFGNNGYIDKNGNLDLEHDAARSLWGGNWRMPTLKEYHELVSSKSTTTEWTTVGGVNGCLIKSKVNGNSVFFPAAGLVEGKQVGFQERVGKYFASGPISDGFEYVGMFNFSSDEVFVFAYHRKGAYSIRAVRRVDEKSFEQERSEIENSLIPTGLIGNRHYVDLGLPSGLKWATYNIGASKPEEYGDHFGWSETSPKDEPYIKGNNATFDKDAEWLLANGYVRRVQWKYFLTPEHDAATQNWGQDWRMPTFDELDELRYNTTTQWVKYNGVEGCLFTSKHNGKSIFLPAAGNRSGTNIYMEGKDGYYWSSSPISALKDSSNGLSFSKDMVGNFCGDRYKGFSLRAVSNSEGRALDSENVQDPVSSDASN